MRMFWVFGVIMKLCHLHRVFLTSSCTGCTPKVDHQIPGLSLPDLTLFVLTFHSWVTQTMLILVKSFAALLQEESSNHHQNTSFSVPPSEIYTLLCIQIIMPMKGAYNCIHSYDNANNNVGCKKGNVVSWRQCNLWHFLTNACILEARLKVSYNYCYQVFSMD